MPLISVCMPVYNAAPFLDAAIASIRAQSVADLEFVIVDDGSSDDSPAIIARHAAADPRIAARRIAHEGVVAAANATIAASCGRYVARMDADDVALPERLALTLARLEAEPALAAVGGAAQMIDAEGRTLARVVRPPTEPAAIAAALPTADVIVHPTTLARREPLQAIGGYRAPFAGAEDIDLWLRLNELGPIANVADVVLRYRRHRARVSFRDAQRQAIAAAAARAAARLRRAGRPDPTQGADALTPAVLERLMLTPGVVHRETCARLAGAMQWALIEGDLDYAMGLDEQLRAIASPAEYLPLASRFAALRARLAHETGPAQR